METLKKVDNKSYDELVALIKQQDTFIDALQQELALSRQRHYGRQSEKDLGQAVQQNLFDEASAPDHSEEIETADETMTVPSYQRKKSRRRPLPKDLPRVQRIHDLEDADKICHCGCNLIKIGEEVSEQLDIIPAKVQVIEHVKYKYACKACEETIKTSSAPQSPIPKSIASPGLLAHVLVAKYKDHLPLYRQESIFKRMNVDIARNTLSHWVIKCSHLLSPLYKLLQDNIVNYDIAYADETRVQVLNEPGRAAQTDSYMWAFIGGPPDKRSIIYHYDPGRAHTVIEERLNEFRGYLHCDGFSGYDAYAVDHDVKLVGCWMHGRRRFAEIIKMTKSNGLAHKAIAMIAKLYKIEKHIKAQGYTHEQITLYRQKQAKPVLDKFKKWLDDNYRTVLPKSPLGKAIGYVLNQWSKLIQYVDEGRLDIDNGLSERTIKPFVIGRKNWMFSTSVAGVQASQIIYSILETCNVNKVEPYSYLRYVLTKLPNIKTEDELQELLPFNIDQAELTN